jgi:hypothetical protein
MLLLHQMTGTLPFMSAYVAPGLKAYSETRKDSYHWSTDSEPLPIHPSVLLGK